MKVLKNLNVVSVKRVSKDNPLKWEWFTFRKGESVPDDLVELVEKKGGILEGEKEEVTEVESVVEEKPKKRGRKKKKKEVVEDDKSVIQKGAEIVKGVVDDLADDGILNDSNKK